MLSTIVTSITLAAATPTPIAGTYVVEGGCPGGPRYNGLITLETFGDAYTLTWKIADDTYMGSALETDGVLAISFSAAHQPGAMYMRRDKTGWGGKWAMTRSNVACTEHWTPRG